MKTPIGNLGNLKEINPLRAYSGHFVQSFFAHFPANAAHFLLALFFAESLETRCIASLHCPILSYI